MHIQTVMHAEGTVAEIINADVIINSAQDALDLMFDPALNGARNIVVHRSQINPEFFDLKTGLAGEVVQKFVNYGIRLAIVGDFENETGALRDYIGESNRGRHLYFVQDSATALEKLR